jgi:hypothetical protein
MSNSSKNPKGGSNQQSGNGSSIDVTITNSFPSVMGNSSMVRTSGSIMSTVSDTIIAQHTGKGVLDQVVRDMVTPLLPLSNMGRILNYLLTRTEGEQGEIMRHTTSVSLYSQLHKLTHKYFDLRSAEMLGYKRSMDGKKDDSKDGEQDFSKLITPRSFILGDAFTYLGDMAGILTKYDRKMLGSINEEINKVVAATLAIEKRKSGGSAPAYPAVKATVSGIKALFESFPDRYEEGSFSNFSSIKGVNDDWIAALSKSMIAPDGTAISGFGNLVSYISNILDIDKENEADLELAIVALLESKWKNISDIILYSDTVYSIIEDSDGYDEALEIHISKMYYVFANQFFPVEKNMAQFAAHANKVNVSGVDNDMVSLKKSDLSKFSDVIKYDHKDGLIALASSLYDKVVTMDSAKSYYDIIESLKYLHNLRIELIEFFEDATAKSKFSFETVNDRFILWRDMATKLITSKDENTADDAIKDFLGKDLWKNSMAGQLYRLSIGDVGMDMQKVAKILTEMGNDTLEKHWRTIGADSISVLSVNTHQGIGTNALQVLGSKEYMLRAKPVSSILYSASEDRVINNVVTARDFFGKEFPEKSNTELPLSVYRMKFFASMADPVVRNNIRKKANYAIGNDFTYERKNKDSFLDKYNKIATALATEMAAYRYALETSVDLQAYASLDFFSYVADVLDTEEIMRHIPVQMGKDKSSHITSLVDEFKKEYQGLSGRALDSLDDKVRLNKPYMIDKDDKGYRTGKPTFVTPDDHNSLLTLILQATKPSFIRSQFGSILTLMKTLKYHGDAALSPRDASHVLQIPMSVYMNLLQQNDSSDIMLTEFDNATIVRPVLSSNEIQTIEGMTCQVGNNKVITTVTPLLELFGAINADSSVDRVPNIVYQGSHASQAKGSCDDKKGFNYGGDILNMSDVLPQLSATSKRSLYSEESGRYKYDRLLMIGFRAFSQLAQFATSRGEWNSYPGHYSSYELDVNYRGFNLDQILELVGLNGDVIITKEETDMIRMYISGLKTRTAFPFVLKISDDEFDSDVTLREILDLDPSFLENGSSSLSGTHTFYMRSESLLHYFASDKIVSTPYDRMELAFTNGLEPIGTSESFNHLIVSTVSVPHGIMSTETRNANADRLAFEWMSSVKPIIDDIVGFTKGKSTPTDVEEEIIAAEHASEEAATEE